MDNSLLAKTKFLRTKVAEVLGNNVFKLSITGSPVFIRSLNLESIHVISEDALQEIALLFTRVFKQNVTHMSSTFHNKVHGYKFTTLNEEVM